MVRGTRNPRVEVSEDLADYLEQEVLRLERAGLPSASRRRKELRQRRRVSLSWEALCLHEGGLESLTLNTWRYLPPGRW